MPRPRSTIATRIFVSFAITVCAFAVTVGWSVVALRRAVRDHEELATGYVPAALKLGQARATQSAISSLLDGLGTERDTLAARLLLDTLGRVRNVKIEESRSALVDGLGKVGSPETQIVAETLVRELTAIETLIASDEQIFDRLFYALSSGDSDEANRIAVNLGGLEHDVELRLRSLSERVSEAMDSIGGAARARETRAILALLTLAASTLAVGVGVSLHTRRLLLPLGDVTERAKAVARGDLSPRELAVSHDEIGDLAASFERMVAAVAKAKEAAVANERLAAIGKMAAHVTHEIRNPLSSISLNLELLEEDLALSKTHDEASRLVRSISREVQRLVHLSEEYLRVARLPSPSMDTDDLAGVIQNIAEFARPEVEHAGCTLSVDVRGPIPPALFDDAQLRQALLNLLRNARESMPDGGPIEIAVSAEGMSVIVEVADRGGGIPEEIRQRVFDPFFSTKGEGTGLGLAITRHIVEAHGGSLGCSNREGGGTRFRIALPMAPSRSRALRVAPDSLRPIE